MEIDSMDKKVDIESKQSALDQETNHYDEAKVNYLCKHAKSKNEINYYFIKGHTNRIELYNKSIQHAFNRTAQ